jgi:hypothetical protein
MAKGSRKVADKKIDITKFFRPHEIHVATALALISTPPSVAVDTSKKEKSLVAVLPSAANKEDKKEILFVTVLIEKIFNEVKAYYDTMKVSLSSVNRCLRLFLEFGWIELTDKEVVVTAEGDKFLTLVAEHVPA